MEGARSTALRRAVRALLIAAAAATLGVAGCADVSAPPAGDAGADVADAEAPCVESAVRCYLGSYQSCQGGRFVERERCGDEQICKESQGCLDCDPDIGKGCRDNAIHVCEANATIGRELESCLGLACEVGACVYPRCATNARVIYVVDRDHRLLSFNPAKETDHFTLIAELRCPAGKPLSGAEETATPFSMSVDRSARAWVLYTSGELFWVDTTSGACTRSPFVRGQEGFQLFGMGFVADEPGADRERLFVFSDLQQSAGPNRLGYIDPATLSLLPVGPVDVGDAENSAELTGTGDGELFAYFPGQRATFVAALGKKDAVLGKRWPVTGVTGTVRSWAFAHWGGKFYIFVTDETGGALRSQVLRLDRDTGESRTFLPSIPYRIVGAGVSTCAPVID